MAELLQPRDGNDEGEAQEKQEEEGAGGRRGERCGHEHRGGSLRGSHRLHTQGLALRAPSAAALPEACDVAAAHYCFIGAGSAVAIYVIMFAITFMKIIMVLIIILQLSVISVLLSLLISLLEYYYHHCHYSSKQFLLSLSL